MYVNHTPRFVNIIAKRKLSRSSSVLRQATAGETGGSLFHERAGPFHCAGLHFRQRHHGALGAPEAWEEWGGEKRTPETRRSRARAAAAARRAPIALGSRGAPPVPHPLGMRARCADTGPPARPSRTGCGRHPGGDKGARPHVRTEAGVRDGRPRGGEWPRGEGPEGPGQGRAGVTCAVVVAPGRWRVGTTGPALRPARAHLWDRGGGPPLEVSRVAHGSFPPPAQALGCAAPSSPHLFLSCRRRPG